MTETNSYEPGYFQLNSLSLGEVAALQYNARKLSVQVSTKSYSKKFLQKLIPNQLDISKEGRDVPSEFSIPGLPFISKTLFSSSSVSGAEPHRADKLGKDHALYERKAVEFVDKVKAEALEKEDPRLFQSDPLEFWLLQETSGRLLDRTSKDFSISGILSENKKCNISPGNVERHILLKVNQNNF